MLYNMSSDESSGTWTRILESARALIEEKPGASISMSQIAQRAGVSRQALYLHFPDRTQLLLAVSRVADDTARTPDRQRRVDAAPTGRQALRAAIALQATIKPQLHGIATALDVLRRTDPAAEAAWTEREQARFQRCEHVIKRIDGDGDLAAGWTVEAASQCFWAVTSQRVWDDLVVGQGWSTPRYRKHIAALLESALLAPDR